MKHAILPREHMKLTIGDMQPGDHGYADHDALFVDNEQRCWLRPEYTVHDRLAGPYSWLYPRPVIFCREDGYRNVR